MNSIEEILKNVPVKPGYTYDELKDVLTVEEKQCLFGYAWAIADLEFVDYEIDTEIESLDNVLNDIRKDAIITARENLIIKMADMLISFGDNHPESEE